MIPLGFVLQGAFAIMGVPEEIPYERMVEITKVQVSPSKEPKRMDLDIIFNLLPDIPKGTKVIFGLQRDGEQLLDASGEPVCQEFVLESESRKNIKLRWTPSVRITCASYIFMTRIPLAVQSPEVQKSLQGNLKRFPEKYDPWPWNHAYQEFKVGTPEQASSEYKEVKDFVEGKKDEILSLNQEAMEEFEKVGSGEAHVKAGKLNVDSIKKYIAGWIERMGKVQKSINEAQTIEPGLYRSDRYQQVYADLMTLGRLISKRISKVELKKVLDKHDVRLSALKLPADRNFDPNYAYSTSVSEIKSRNESIDRSLWSADPQNEGKVYVDPEESGEKAGDKKKAEPGPEGKPSEKAASTKDKEPEEGSSLKEGEETKSEPKSDTSKKDNGGKKDPKKKASPKKTGKKAPE